MTAIARNPVFLGLYFLLELVAFFSLGYWGFSLGVPTVLNFVLGLGIPLIGMVAWGTFASPRASVKLPPVGVFVFKLAFFVIAAAALYFGGAQAPGLAFGAVAVIAVIIEFLAHQPVESESPVRH